VSKPTSSFKLKMIVRDIFKQHQIRNPNIETRNNFQNAKFKYFKIEQLQWRQIL